MRITRRSTLYCFFDIFRKMRKTTMQVEALLRANSNDAATKARIKSGLATLALQVAEFKDVVKNYKPGGCTDDERSYLVKVMSDLAGRLMEPQLGDATRRIARRSRDEMSRLAADVEPRFAVFWNGDVGTAKRGVCLTVAALFMLNAGGSRYECRRDPGGCTFVWYGKRGKRLVKLPGVCSNQSLRHLDRELEQLIVTGAGGWKPDPEVVDVVLDWDFQEWLLLEHARAKVLQFAAGDDDETSRDDDDTPYARALAEFERPVPPGALPN